MGQNREKHRIDSHLINHCPTSSGVSKASSERAQRSARAKRVVRSKRTNELCKRTSEGANGRASGPVLISGFLIILAHSLLVLVLVVLLFPLIIIIFIITLPSIADATEEKRHFFHFLRKATNDEVLDGWIKQIPKSQRERERKGRGDRGKYHI